MNILQFFKRLYYRILKQQALDADEALILADAYYIKKDYEMAYTMRNYKKEYGISRSRVINT